MANPFLNKTDLVDRDIETAIMLEKATRYDIGKAVAYTDGNKVFINTDDNLFNILPAYDQRMLKWLLWHERMHMELKHHNRFFKYLDELKEEETLNKFHVTKEEVNIIMDILVHDWMTEKFPELIETAVNNLAQMRDRNSLSYTFTTHTLEEMLDEYARHKKDEDGGDGEGEGEGEGKSKDGKGEGKGDDKTEEGPEGKKKTHGKSGADSPSSEKGEKKEDGEPEENDGTPEPARGEHDKTDWSKLKDIDSKEFITKEESWEIDKAVERLRAQKFKLAKLTETLNGLVTSTRKRSYKMPSTVHVGKGIILKGSTPGKVNLYLCFDASGSMGSEMEMFKEIISKSIPQAMQTTTEWFSGGPYEIREKFHNPEGRDYDYCKGKFKDFMKVYATSGYDDDGDRTIEMCYLAEQKGFTPIGVTDGGGQISWSKDKLKQLQRTILVGQNKSWLEKAKSINPKIQILDI